MSRRVSAYQSHHYNAPHTRFVKVQVTLDELDVLEEFCQSLKMRGFTIRLYEKLDSALIRTRRRFEDGMRRTTAVE